MEYNTQRPQLRINDYGRNICKLIEYAKTVEDRDRRNQMAAAIVDIMSRISTDVKEGDDYKRKFWVHLMILANWELDVDVPYEISRDETVEFTPHPLAYNQGNTRYRHYGSVMESMIRRVADYPEGEERDELVGLLAHAMKRDYLLWNRDTVEDDLISLQLNAISGGRLVINDEAKMNATGEILGKVQPKPQQQQQGKKKKKKVPNLKANMNNPNNPDGVILLNIIVVIKIFARFL